jgi:hypothetical protein
VIAKKNRQNVKQTQFKAKQSQFFGGQSLILAKKRGFSTNLEHTFYAKQSQFQRRILST